MLLDHWLKWIEKSFSKFLSQVQRMNVASSNNLLALKAALEKTMEFLSFQIDHISAIHQHCHLLSRAPSTWISINCWKCCLGVRGIAPFKFGQDIVSHQRGWILLQCRNRWAASSSLIMQKGHEMSVSCTCLRCKFSLVGNLSLSSLHTKTITLLGTFMLHNFE